MRHYAKKKHAGCHPARYQKVRQSLPQGSGRYATIKRSHFNL